MKKQSIMNNHNTTQIKKDGKTYLAISTGLETRSFKGVNTAKLKSSPGVLISGDMITDWKVEGFTEIDGIMYYYGPYLDGEILNTFQMNDSVITNLLDAFVLLDKTDYSTKLFSLNSVFITNDNTMLFSPPGLMNFINSWSAESENLTKIYPWNNPNLQPEQARAFIIAGLTYHLICGRQAFPGQFAEEIEKNIKNSNYASPLLEAPGLRTEISGLIDESFRETGSIAKWQRTLKLYSKDGWYNNSLSDQETADILTAAEKTELKRQKKNRIKLFFTKNKTRLVISFVAAVVLSLIVIPPVMQSLAPPITVGMSQTEVIRLYYDSMSIIDFETMEDCITKKVGKDDINQAVSVSAITRTRSAYEQTSGFITAEEWINSGRPPIKEGTLLWGVSSLRIDEITPSQTFIVSYEKWAMEEAEVVQDIIHISLIKDAWRIDSLERTITGKINYGEQN